MLNLSIRVLQICALASSASMLNIGDINRNHLIPPKVLEPFRELASDSGRIGQALRHFANAVLPGNGSELLREAARRETDGDDPWEFLLGVPNAAQEYLQVFRAAQSQRFAWRRLLDAAHGWGNLREKCEPLRKTPPNTPIRPAQRQWFSRMWRVSRWALLDDPKLSVDMRREIEKMGKKEDRKLYKRYDRTAVEQGLDKPNPAGIYEDKVDYMLVRHWVRCGSKGPGLMFFSSGAITHYIHELHSWEDWRDHVAWVKKKRQRLGLVLADEDNPFFRRIQFRHALSTLSGEGRSWFKFEGEILFAGKRLFPR
jgi:hypothetical protein